MQETESIAYLPAEARPAAARQRPFTINRTARMTRFRWALVLVFALGAAPLHAQDAEEDAPEPAPRGRTAQLAALGLRYGAPLGASAYTGVIIAPRGPDFIQGPSIIGEVGQDGMRLSVGMSSVSLGGSYRAQASLIRTWDPHADIEPGQTYLGPEVSAGLILGITVGHYWRISDGGGPARFFAIGSFLGV
ncbi:MAG TPA: hypothetical protein VGB24_17680 [Longimicrobium sp.]